MSYTVYADVRELTHDQWLENRKSGIGGSDAGAIMGVNPYRGAYSVWADKLGKTDPVEDNEALRQGRDFEDYVARRFSEKTGLRVRREYGMLRSDAWPWMVANIDRRIIGERAGLECKTSRDIYMKRYKNGDFPLEYYCQCLHYLAVTGWDKWYLAVLVYGTDLLTFEIKREDVEDDIGALINAEDSFWHEYILPERQPLPDGLESTTKALGAVWADSTPDMAIDADNETDALLSRLCDLKRERKTLDDQIAEAENMVKAQMQEAEEMRGTGATATWKGVDVKRLSERKIKEKFPWLDIDELKETTHQRRFALKTEEE